MAHGATNEKLWREQNVCCFLFCILLHLITLPDDPDNWNLSSPYHYPSWKNSTLLSSGCHWRPKKKNYWSFWSHGIWTQNQGTRTKSTLPLNWTTVQYPERCVVFLPPLPASHTTTPHRTPNEPSCAIPWCPPRWCLTTAVVVQNLRRATYSRPTWLISGWCC
jgi:hypothetical protein